MGTFSICPADPAAIDDAAAVLKRGEVTFVSGLLLQEFKAPKDKPSLRSNVLKHLGLFKKASKADLPKVLRSRAEQAVAFKLAV